MFSLATIQRLNAVAENRKLRRRARAMNAKRNKETSPKNAEKTGVTTATVNCAQCGALAIFESAAEGYYCPACGSSDSDE